MYEVMNLLMFFELLKLNVEEFCLSLQLTLVVHGNYGYGG